MKNIAILFFSMMLLCIPCSADNVTIEVMQNTLGEYYVSYNDDIIRCDNNTCVFDVDYYTTNNTDFVLSSSDIRKIAQRVAIEVNIPTQTDNANETFIVQTLGTNREDITDNLRAFITNTLMPTVEEFDELRNKLAETEVIVADYESKAREYDSLKETKDETISVIKSENEWLKYLCGILTLTVVAILAFNSQSFKRIIELKRRKQ